MSLLLLLSFAVFAPVLVGAATLALPRSALRLRVLLNVLAPAATLACLATYVARAGIEATVPTLAWMPALHLDFSLRGDRLSLFFAFLVAAIGLLVSIYSRAYFGPDRASLYRFYPSLHLFMTSMLGLVLADNLLLLLLFWEMTSISSFLLIGWERDDPASVRSSMQAFIVTNAGGLFLMAGIVCIGIASGGWSFSELTALSSAGALPRSGMMVAGFVLMFIGGAAKSAQWPLHFWLPGAMAAPTPVSAYLHSATMVKAGIYLVGRLWPMLAVLPFWPKLIIPIGASTMLLGAYIALRKSDLKQIFAYTTVSQLGLLMTMYGLGGLTYHGERNLMWDVSQILNHALYKAPLFILAGAIGHVIHTRELPRMRGLARRGGEQGVMAMLLILAAYALAAGPFTFSFTAKEFFLYQVYHAQAALGPAAFYALAAISLATASLNVAIFVRLARVLLGQPDARPHPVAIAPSIDAPAQYVAHHAVSRSGADACEEDIDVDIAEAGRFWPAMLWVPAAVLLLCQFIVGLVPGAHAALFGSLERPESLVEPFATLSSFPMTWTAFAHPSPPLYMSLVATGIGIAIGFAPVMTSVVSDIHDRLFPAFYDLAVKGGGAVFSIFQSGHLRTYVSSVMLALVALFAWSMSGLSGYLHLPDNLNLVDRGMLPAYLLAGLMCLAAVSMTVIRHRAGRILMLGTAGTAAAALFYVYEAPDLALTQISIEVVSLILFLLVLALIPNPIPRPRTRVPARLALSLAVGLVMAALTLSASSGDRPRRLVGDVTGKPLATLGDFFLRNSYIGRDTLGVTPERVTGGLVNRTDAHVKSFGGHPSAEMENGFAGGSVHLHKGGGGANVVNVILVDFRGFDTMGEITVLALAALGVWTLFRQRGGEHTIHPAAPFVDNANTVILLQGARLLVPLSLLVSAYIFFKGHDTPGGGFVGGLVAAVALILFRISQGPDAMQRLIPIRPHLFIALGLALAAVTGAAALMLDLPFLTSNHGYLPLRGDKYFHWATVMFFDAGVFLVVVGVTVGMIDALSRELEREESTS